jgi:uncharacterized membrane-anchored protein YitT (DUF2179 family)
MKDNKKNIIISLIGITLFCISINLFIRNNNLYNDGILGVSQLLNNLIIKLFHIKMDFDFSGIINFFLNIPLFILAYKSISKEFFWKTLIAVIFQTILLSIIPIPKESLVSDTLTSVLIGGILAGIGAGMTLSSGASGGGTEIIGMFLLKKDGHLSVGKINLGINLVLFSICGLLYGVETMIYSIIYVAITSLMIDRTHAQNICTKLVVFTKNDPQNLIDYVENNIERGITYFKAKGGYDNSTTYICYIVLTKYECREFENNLKNIDPNAFIVKDVGVQTLGNFQKIWK